MNRIPVGSIRLKRKAKRAELGVPLSILEESSGFIMAWRLHWEGGDTEVAVSLVEDAKARFPALTQCSFDRGYHSLENQKKLGELLDQLALPVKARRQHPAVESRFMHWNVTV